MSTALILSGGGAKGAFTVGALSYILKERPDIQFDILSGSSTGSLIASLLIIDEIDLLRIIYLTVNNDDIVLAQDPFKNLKKNQPYIFSDAPLANLVDQNITQSRADRIINSPKTLFLTAINLQTGRITVFSNKDIPATNEYDVMRIRTRGRLLEALRASSNQAVFMPPVLIKDDNGVEHQYIDGGNREVIPCLAVVHQNPSEVYVLSNNPKQIFSVEDKFTNVLKILFRSISIFIQDVRENDMVALENWCKSDGRAVPITKIDPVDDLDRDFPTGLRFEPGRMGEMMSNGEARARAILGPAGISPRTLAPTISRDFAPTGSSRSVGPAHGKKKSASVKKAQPKGKKCQAITQAGKKCKNLAVEKGYCRVHMG